MKYRPPQPQSYSAETAALITQLKDRIQRLEEELMDAKDKHAVLVADVVLNEDKGERIKRLEAVVNDPHALWANWLRGDVKLPEGIGDVRQYQDRIKRLEEENNELRAAEARLLNTNGGLERRIHRAGMAFFRDGSDGHVASQMLAILEERGKP